jgi:uncharacterized protein (TIGR02284 family)
MYGPFVLRLVITSVDFRAGPLFFLIFTRPISANAGAALWQQTSRRKIMDENNAISVVENLIETSKDGQKGYQDAAQHVKRTDLKTYFNEQSSERGRFAQELQAELAKFGEPGKKVSGSVSATLHRAWIDTKVSLGGGDKTILESVEKGEDNAKETYQKALTGTLPSSLTEIVRRQAASVQKAHDKVKTLRDTAEAAA